MVKGKGFSAHPPAIHSHANQVSQRANQVSSSGNAIGGAGTHSNAFGAAGYSTAASHQKFAQTAGSALNKAGSGMHTQAGNLHKTGQSISDVDVHNKAKFNSIGGYGAGGGSKAYDPSKYVPPGYQKPKPQPKPAPEWKSQWADKQWYGSSKFEAAQSTRTEFSKVYPNYWEHRDKINSEIRPYHPEYSHINTADLVGVRGYTTNDYYSKVNKALATGDKATVDKYSSNIKTAISGLNGMPKYKGETVRKISVPDSGMGNVLAKYKVGRTVQEDTFVSTTAGKTNSFSGNVVMHINSKTGHPIANLSKYSTEGEVLFGPGSKFKVNDRWYDKNSSQWHINMSEA